MCPSCAHTTQVTTAHPKNPGVLSRGHGVREIDAKGERVFRSSATIFLFLGSVLGSVAFTPAARGAVYYVAIDGNDANAGTVSSPFRTINFAYEKTVAGDTVIVKPGVYTDVTMAKYSGLYGLYFGHSGTSTHPITIKSQIKWQAIIDGQNVAGRDRVLVLGGIYNIVDGFQIRYGKKAGVTLYGSNNQLINNEIHHNGNLGDATSTQGQDGVFSDPGVHDNLYAQNYIHDNGRISLASNLDHGLYLCGDNEAVVNNVVTGNSAYGLQIAGYSTVTNMKVYNNVFAKNGRSGIVVWQAIDQIFIENNIFYNNERYAVRVYNTSGGTVAIDNNIMFGNLQGTVDT